MQTKIVENSVLGKEQVHHRREMDSLEVVHFEAKCALKIFIEDRRDALRASINIASRPFLRPLNILDIPNEVLVRIFEYVKGARIIRFGRSEINSKEINNVRLTCWRFCDMSSHLLMRFLRVEMNDCSLVHLDEVAHHPTISKGIRNVRVIIHFYDSIMANDLSIFGTYYLDELRTITELAKREAPHRVFDGSEDTESSEGTEYTKGTEDTEDAILEAVQQMTIMLNAWDSLLNGIPDNDISEQDLHFRSLLRRAHKEYTERFIAQQRLREDGTFVKAISTAISIMPLSNEIETRDFNLEKSPSVCQQAKTEAALFQVLLLPHSWEMARYNNLGSPPTELLVQLPIAIHKAGTLLTNNLLNVSPPAELFVIHPINQDFFDLTAAVKYLKNFAFLLDCQSYSDHWGPLSAKDFKLLGQVLAAFTNTTTLEDSKLSLNGLWDDERPPAASLGSIINVRSYPNLRHVDWSGLSIHLSELEHGIQLLRERSPISALTTRTCGQGPGLRP